MNVIPLVARPTWIGQMDLGAHRFDPLYYDPSLTIAEQLYKANGQLKWKRLQEVTTDIYSFGAYELTGLIKFAEPGPNTVPFINVTEIGNLYVDIGQARHIDTASHRLLHKSVCYPGTILLSMSGSIGRVAVVPGSIKECNSNQHLAKIVVDTEKSDSYFIAAYFATSVGQGSCHREAAGAVQKELYLYNISTLPVPDPSLSIRLAIGNKVRAAEVLRGRVSNIWTSFTVTMQNLVRDFQIPNSQQWTASYVVDELTPRRTDADYYRANDLTLRNAMTDAGFVTLESQCEFIQSGSTPREVGGRFRVVGVGSLRTPVIEPGIDYFKVVTTVIRLQVGDVLLCNAAHDSAFIGRLNAVVGENDNLVPSSEVMVCRPKVASHGVMIAHFLNTPFGYTQVQRAVRGMTAHLYPEDLGDVLIPQFKESCSGFEAELVNLTSRWRRAESLITAAIQDIDNLIEGKLDEFACLEEGRKLANEFGLERP